MGDLGEKEKVLWKANPDPLFYVLIRSGPRLWLVLLLLFILSMSGPPVEGAEVVYIIVMGLIGYVILGYVWGLISNILDCSKIDYAVTEKSVYVRNRRTNQVKEWPLSSLLNANDSSFFGRKSYRFQREYVFARDAKFLTRLFGAPFRNANPLKYGSGDGFFAIRQSDNRKLQASLGSV